MAIAHSLIAEMDHESAATRKHLERVPAHRFDYKPHDKCMTLIQLASHIVESLTWGITTIKEPEFVMDIATYKPWIAKDVEDLLDTYDKHSAELKSALANATDDEMMAMWTMKGTDGSVIFTMPRVVVMRSFVLNHCYHHRAQLGLYLRLLDVPVPQSYGPTSDEPQMTMGG